jgi:two-component system sensor histidine kinase NblS
MATRLQAYDAANIEELTAAQIKQQSLIATMADGALLLDKSGNVVLSNPTARRLFRWEGRNLENVELLRLLPDSLSMELQEPLEQMLCGQRDNAELRCAMGEPARTLRLVLQAVRDGSGESLKGIAVTVQDLTREVELNAAQSRFISNVSHELRTPLFNIKSYVETLHDMWEDLNDEQRQEFLFTANAETDRLTRLVNDVLDLSRLESDRVWSFEPMELDTAIEQTLRSYRLNAQDKGVALELDLAVGLPRVRGNYDMMLQVFDNLVGNALKFTAPGGMVHLRAYPWPDTCPVVQGDNSSPLPRIRVEIADSGSGIGEDDCRQVFERFFRVENAVHTEAGTGLGLSIVRGILDKHGTQARIVSELGTGTTFWFELPLEQSDGDEVMLSKTNRNLA